ncbi:hypothetical protein MHBO_003934, partial [Bonamia ostreae]
YLGRKKREKRVIPLDHRQRFNFDWEPTEDTSVDPNELYAKKADVSLAFGRGFVAGVDREAQKTRNSAFLEMLRKHKAREPRRMARIIERKEERIRRLKEKRLARKSAHHLWKHKKLEDMTDRDWRIFREDFGISTRGIGKFTPIRYWEESALDKRIKEELRRARYRDPTPVQRMAIPIGLARRDIVGIAETGSGKTCAFVIPMLEYILKLPPLTPQNSADGPYAVILAPSRELAEQIERETERFAKPLGVRTVSIIGGVLFSFNCIFEILQNCVFVSAKNAKIVVLSCLTNQFFGYRCDFLFKLQFCAKTKSCLSVLNKVRTDCVINK